MVGVAYHLFIIHISCVLISDTLNLADVLVFIYK